jgi:hypothetical protein
MIKLLLHTDLPLRPLPRGQLSGTRPRGAFHRDKKAPPKRGLVSGEMPNEGHSYFTAPWPE